MGRKNIVFLIEPFEARGYVIGRVSTGRSTAKKQQLPAQKERKNWRGGTWNFARGGRVFLLEGYARS